MEALVPPADHNEFGMWLGNLIFAVCMTAIALTFLYVIW